MNTQFRRRTPQEFLKIIKRRKWLIGLPAVAVFVSVAYIVANLPDLYESTTLLTITPPKISEKVAPSLTDADVSQRLKSIEQIVLSRTSLEPMITQYGLFEKERNSGVPMDQIVESFKKSIVVEPEMAENNNVVGFKITHRNNDPATTQKVVATLADKYVNAQVADSLQSAETTKEFIDEQIAQAKSNLDALDKQRLAIMSRNIEALPESGAGLIAQLQGLRQSEQTLSKDKESLIGESGRIQETIRAINSQINLITTFGENETKDALTQATRIEDTPAYAELVQKRAELTAKLETLRMQYRDKNPEIINVQSQIKSVNEEIEKLGQNTDKRIKSASESSARKAELQRRSLQIEKEKAESNLETTNRLIAAKDNDLRQNAAQISVIEARINSIPGVKVELESVNNQYASAKTAYDDLLKKYNNAQQQVDREVNKQGETIRVVDPASLPVAPVNAKKKPLFMAFGLLVGLGLGLAAAAALEVPKFLRIQDSMDVEHYTGLKVMAVIPPLRSESELAASRRMQVIGVMGGVLAAVASVPLIIMLLQVTHLFERFS